MWNQKIPSVPYIFVLDFRFFKIEINYISIFWSHVIIDFQPPLSTVIIWTPNELFLFVKLVNFHILNTNELFLFAKLVNFHYFHLARLPSTLCIFFELLYYSIYTATTTIDLNSMKWQAHSIEIQYLLYNNSLY